MSVRKFTFENGGIYHIFNRGVDKRNIFVDRNDINRFFKSMKEFNVVDPIESIYVNTFRKNKNDILKQKRLVDFICYCLNLNHFHFILEQLVDNGISKFMQRIGGYSTYFNLKHGRSGALFQGKFKAIYLSDDKLLNTSVYVNLNDRVHQLSGKAAKLSKSSWNEYKGKDNSNFCKKDSVLDQFDSIEEYKTFAMDSLKDIRERKEMEQSLLTELLE
jgi:putative transposase